MLDQGLRRQYLKALGIQLWVPRVELPGAKSVCADTTAAGNSPDCTAESIALKTQHRVEIDNNLRLDSEHQQRAVSAKATPEKQPVCINMATVFYTGQCLVIAQLETGETQLSAPSLRLLSELLHALGVDIDQKVSVNRLDWPAQQSVDSQPGFETLLQSLQLKQPGKFVLLLGEGPYRLLKTDPSDFLGGCGELVSFGKRGAIATLALAQMLDKPKLKAQVWSDLQPLCRWLMADRERG